MSLRSTGYLPAMARRPETPVLGSLSAAKVEAHNCEAFTITGKGILQWAFDNDDYTNAGQALGPLADALLRIANVIAYLGSLPTGEDAEDLAHVSFMHDRGRTLPLVDPPQGIPADIFGKAVKAAPALPDSWTASMRHDALEKMRLTGNPRLNGGPLGV